MTLRGVTFPVYAAENRPARIVGSGSSGNDLTELTVGHHAEENDDPFTAPDLRITTSIREAHDTVLRRARRALEMWVHDAHNHPWDGHLGIVWAPAHGPWFSNFARGSLPLCSAI
jgi:hypothetical protein